MTGLLEHVNLTVTDPEASAARLCALFDWKVRWSGPSQMGGRTVHVGTEEAYVALYTPEDGSRTTYPKGEPLNHVGVVVSDLDAVEERARTLGLKPFGHGDYEPGRRFYLLDDDRIEFEVVSYG